MKALFGNAHPDDEINSLHALSQWAVKEEVFVLTATDGTASTVDRIGNGFVVNGDRRGEAEAGLQSLGIDRDHRLYLGLPDGQLDRHVSEIAEAAIALSIRHDIDVFVSCDEEGHDGHADHVAVHGGLALASLELAGRGVRHLVYSRYWSPGSLAIQGDPAIKREYMNFHRSQWNTGDPEFMRWFEQDYAGGFETEYYNEQDILLPLGRLAVPRQSDAYLLDAVSA